MWKPQIGDPEATHPRRAPRRGALAAPQTAEMGRARSQPAEEQAGQGRRVSIVLGTWRPEDAAQRRSAGGYEWAPWDSNPARRVKSPVLYQMS